MDDHEVRPRGTGCFDGNLPPYPNLLNMHTVLSKIWEDTGMEIYFEELEDICHLPQLAPLPLFLTGTSAACHNMYK